jgi:oxalate decarboxylase
LDEEVDFKPKETFMIPGPNTPSIADNFPSFLTPPSTNTGSLPLYWSSFNTAPKKVKAGGWARQVSQDDFKISKDITGIDMRLEAGAIRELHWHTQSGSCRITIIDTEGRPYAADVNAGDLWYFPAGCPHSLQGLGPDGAQFTLAFDSGNGSEYNTLLVTDLMAHIPLDILSMNFEVPEAAFANLPQQNKWIFPGEIPGSLAQTRVDISSDAGHPPLPFIYRLSSATPNKITKGGNARIADSTVFKIAKTIASVMITLHPGALREIHWHPNADEWLYFIKGTGRMTVYAAGPNAVTADFHPGDIGYVLKSNAHYIQNTGAEDLVYMEVFKAPKFEEILLSDWLAHSPPAMVAATLNMSLDDIAKFPKNRPDIVPE